MKKIKPNGMNMRNGLNNVIARIIRMMKLMKSVGLILDFPTLRRYSMGVYIKRLLLQDMHNVIVVVKLKF